MSEPLKLQDEVIVQAESYPLNFFNGTRGHISRWTMDGDGGIRYHVWPISRDYPEVTFTEDQLRRADTEEGE